MLKSHVLATLLGLSLLTQPVCASESPEPEREQANDRLPPLAAYMGWGVTAALLYLEGPYELPLLGFGQLATIAALAPAGFGAGHFYAGDPARGTLVALGGPVVTTGSAMTIALLYDRFLNPASGPFSSNTNIYLNTWLITGLAYGAWASWDAYLAAERFNRSKKAQAASPDS